VSAATAFARAEAAAQAATDALLIAEENLPPENGPWDADARRRPNLAPGPQSLGSRCGYPERRQAASIMTRKRQHRTAKLLLDKWRPETPRFNDIVLEQSV
jgi:hypothetical protein